MKWTKEKPKVAGWYWCKTLWWGILGAEMVAASENPVTHKVDSIYYEGHRYTLDDEHFLEYSGPIPLPENNAPYNPL